MTNNQTIVIVIFLVFYFVGLGFMFNAIGNDLPTVKSSIGSESKSFCKEIKTNTIGVPYCAEQTVIGNIVTGISNIPLWINVVFIVIPLILLTLGIILLIIHG